MWDTRLTYNSKFQRYFDTKLDKVIGVTYVSNTTNTEINNFRIENWCKTISNKILKIGVCGIFHIEVDVK